MSKTEKTSPPEHDSKWGEAPDNFGYASEEERHNKRGLEDWEIVDKIPESQHNVPYWFIAVVFVVLLVAIGLSFPFWGDRPGQHRPWVDWGFAAAIVWIFFGIGFVYYMMNLYGSSHGGRLDSDKDADRSEGDEE